MTSYDEGVGETIRYQLDNGQPLAAVGTESTSFYLYGRGVIGTKTDSWAYVLQDGLGSTRQLATHEGVIAMSVAYTPWPPPLRFGDAPRGDVLAYYGSGGIDFGYLGGSDENTGLIYLGSGQYYDPVTGRMLTGGTGQSNPYKPGAYDPAGMMVAPLAVLGLVLGRKKKRGKWDSLIVLLVMCVVVGMSVSACKPNNPAAPKHAPDSPQSENIASGPGTVNGVYATSPVAPSVTPAYTCTVSPTATATLTPTSTPTPATIDEALANYGVIVGGEGTWSPVWKEYLLAAIEEVDKKLSDAIKIPQTKAFSAIFGKSYEFKTPCQGCGETALGYTYSDHIEFKGFYSGWFVNEHPGANVHLIIHELGHAFDYQVCKATDGNCLDGNTLKDERVRKDLDTEINRNKNLERSDYGSFDAYDKNNSFNGFAGGFHDWQYATSGTLSQRGEIWADMFLGWIYGNLGHDRQKYMDETALVQKSLHRESEA